MCRHRDRQCSGGAPARDQDRRQGWKGFPTGNYWRSTWRPRPGRTEGSARWVHALLDETLDDTEKKVFTLHYGDDVPLDAITRLLGLSNRSGAKAYIVRARRKLTRALRSAQSRDRALG